MFSTVSAERTSSGSRWGTTRTLSEVGPAVVDGNSGGATCTSTSCCVPPNSVIVAGSMVVQAAAIPEGVSTNESGGVGKVDDGELHDRDGTRG